MCKWQVLKIYIVEHVFLAGLIIKLYTCVTTLDNYLYYSNNTKIERLPVKEVPITTTKQSV